MKLFRLTIFTTLILLLWVSGVYAHGNMITVYNTSQVPTSYTVIPEEQLNIYVSEGWTNIIPEHDPAVLAPMYTDDGKMEFFRHGYTEPQRELGWHYVPRKMMYTADNRTTMVNIGDIAHYETVSWHIEPVAVMRCGEEYRYVIESEIEAYRRSGWFVTDYCAQLYDLGTQLKQYIASGSGQYGVYIKNLKTNRQLIINDNKYASASIIKLFVMAGLYNEISYGSVAKNWQIDRCLNSMITVSDNYSSNFLVKTIGGGNYQRGFNAENAHSASIGCINTQHMSLFIGYGDYVSYGRNLVSPVDCGILLEKMYRRTLVTPEYSDEMLSLMKMQQRRNKIPYYLPKDVVCANKTGETSRVESDVAIVYSPNCDYIICVLSNNAGTGINDIRQISLMTYNYFN